MEIAPTPPPKPPDTFKLIFFNDRGLRAGWRLLIFIVIFLVLQFAVQSAAAMVWAIISHTPPGHMAPLSPPFMLVTELLAFLVVVFASWIMSRIERRSMAEYGLPLKNSSLVSRFVIGYIFWGFLPLTLLLLVLRALHAFYFGVPGLHGVKIFEWAALWWMVFLLVGLAEEYTLRGYALTTLADGIGFWPAAIVLAALFALGHSFNQGESRIGIVMTAVFAIFASIVFWRTGNLWLAVGAHAGWDWGESYFYGVNDSGFQAPGHLFNPHILGPGWLNGGSVGPEGSILVLVVLALMSVAVLLVYRRQNGSTRPAALYTVPLPRGER